jgi:hypothetical protein
MRAAALVVGVVFVPASGAMAAQTYGYMVSSLSTATWNDYATNCPQNLNGYGLDVTRRDLIAIGFSKEEAEKMTGADADAERLPRDVAQRLLLRATVNGKPVSHYSAPEAVPNPPVIESVVGPVALGFDLDGKITGTEFTDPETGAKIDNQLWRAIGCSENFRAIPPALPFTEELTWALAIDSAPAWMMSITGEDLTKDGPVTVTFERATKHLERDANGDVMTHATYVVDPMGRSHNVLKGEIKGGFLTVANVPKFYLQSEMPFFPEIELDKAQMRMQVMPNGKLLGYWGGYYDWKRYAYMITSRPGSGADTLGLYHSLKRFADATPDPKTGQNTQISMTYRMEAVPAFHSTVDGKILASPAADASVSAAMARRDPEVKPKAGPSPPRAQVK